MYTRLLMWESLMEREDMLVGHSPGPSGFSLGTLWQFCVFLA